MKPDDAEKSTVDEPPEKKIFYMQHLASVTLSLVMLLVGLTNGWSSPYLAKLALQDITDGISRATDEQLTWVASLMNMGRIFGAVVGAVAQDSVGRKMSLCFAGIPLMSGWICISLATSITWLYVARIAWGVAMGMIWTTLSLYLAEIADPEIRGSLVLWNITSQSIGLFAGNLMGPHLTMKNYAYVCMVPNCAFLLLFPLIPDSPYRYAMCGDYGKAELSLQWFRRRKDVKRELMELRDYVDGSRIGFWERIKELGKPRYLKSIGMMFVINVFNFFGAYNVINNYMEIILSRAGVGTLFFGLAPSTIVSASGFFSIITGLAATCLVDRLGRRFLLLASSLGMALFLGILGVHFHLITIQQSTTTNLAWLPCACLLLYTAFYSTGCGCVPSTLVGELFSPGLKTIASLSFSGTSALFSSLSTGTFVPLLNAIGPSQLFWFYASGTLASVLYYYFFVPETMGKSLRDIQTESSADTDGSPRAKSTGT